MWGELRSVLKIPSTLPHLPKDTDQDSSTAKIYISSFESFLANSSILNNLRIIK